MLLVLQFCQAQIDSSAHKALEEAKSLLDLRLYDSAYIGAGQAISFAESLNDSIILVDALQTRGLAKHFQHKLKEVRPLYERAIAIGIKVLPPDTKVMGRLYNNLGAVHTDLGNRLEARKYLERGMEVNLQIPDNDPTIATNHYNLGLSCMYFQENREALDHFLTALPSYLKEYGENSSRAAQLYNNVGILYRDDGDYEKALEYFQRSIDIHLFNHDSNYWNLAYPYTTMASAFNEMGDYEKSFNYYVRALRICKQNPLQRLEGIVHSALSLHYIREKDFDQAIDNIETAIQIFLDEYGADHPRLGDFYRFKARAYSKSGDRDLAQEWYRQSIEQIQKNYGEYHPKISSSFLEMAADAKTDGDYDLALQHLDDAEKYFRAPIGDETLKDTSTSAIYNYQYLFRITLQRANIERQQYEDTRQMDDIEEALSLYQKGAKLADQIRRRHQSESAKLFLQKNASFAYEGGAWASLALYELTSDPIYKESLFYFIEKNQASVLSEALRYNQLDKFNDVPDDIIAREKELAQSIKELHIKTENAPKSEHDSILNALTLTLFNAQRTADSLNNIIEKRYPAYHQLKYGGAEISIEAVQSSIDNHTIVLSFLDAENSVYVLAIGNEETKAYLIDSSDRMILSEIRHLLSNSDSDIENLKRKLMAAYEFILAPAIMLDKRVQKLVILPNGVLSHLPIGALIWNDPVTGTNEYVIQRYPVLYASSASLLTDASKGPRKIETAYIGFAPYYSDSLQKGALAMRSGQGKRLSNLEGAVEEVSFARDLLGGQVYLGDKATESTLKTIKEPFAILHLAMHAELDDTDPDQSLLYFSSEDSTKGNDGLLKAFEIYNMQLEGDLVVLSACNTGDGTLSKGEGVLSISRAFRYAGCPNILMSLWRANDLTTKEIIKSFFTKLKDGMDKDVALQQAKIEFLNSADPLMAHPSNWSTLQLQGDLGSISLTKNLFGTLLPIALGLLSVVILGYGLIHRNRQTHAAT